MLANKLYGLNFTPNDKIEVYHPDVTAYDVTDENGRFMAVLYLDFFPRESKRSGAWMTEFRGTKSRGRQGDPSAGVAGDELHQTHRDRAVAADVRRAGDFPPRVRTRPARHAGRGQIRVADRYERLPRFRRAAVADHGELGYREGIPRPVGRELPDRRADSRRNRGTHYRGAELSGRLPERASAVVRPDRHGMAYASPSRSRATSSSSRVASMAPSQVQPVVPGTAMAPAFGHIFSGGYAAGYYGYKWAEVLEADAFSLFKEKGIFNREAAGSFRENILSKGGTRASDGALCTLPRPQTGDQGADRKDGVGKVRPPHPRQMKGNLPEGSLLFYFFVRKISICQYFTKFAVGIENLI